MREDLLEAAREAVRLAREAGADEAFATATRSRVTEMRFLDRRLERCQEAISRSIGLRILVDGRFSSQSTTDLRPERLKAFTADSVALTRALEPDPWRKLADPSLFARIPDEGPLDLIDPSLETLSLADREAWLAAMADAALAHPRVISVEASSADEHDEGAAVGTNGFEGTWEGSSLWLGAEITVRDEGDRRPRNGTWMGARQRADLPDPRLIGEDALKVAAARLGTRKGPTARTVMVVDPRAGGRLLALLLRANNGRALQQKESFWGALWGKEAFAPALTVADDPLRRRGLASRCFDGEGIAAQPRTVIEAGVPRTPFLDTYYAGKLGQAPTTGGPSNLVVAPGDRALAAILGDLTDAVYVTGWLGGNSDSTTGDFSLGCQGHRIKGGVIGEPVGEMNVTGNLVALFGRLVEVGSDPWIYGATQCPTLVFDGVQFSGA